MTNRLFAAMAIFALAPSAAFAKEIHTNNIDIQDAPAWLTQHRVEKVTDHVGDFLEWDIRKARVIWYTDEAAFERAHGFGPGVYAFSRKSDSTVHVGPRVNDSNFDRIFGHELGHIVMFQKYKDAIPNWLEEGLANASAGRTSVDYNWLARQQLRPVNTLVHPFKGSSGTTPDSRYHYLASTALVEMLSKKCGLHDLLQLSVGKKLENFLSTFCEIEDINSEFRKWVLSRKSR